MKLKKLLVTGMAMLASVTAFTSVAQAATSSQVQQAIPESYVQPDYVMGYSLSEEQRNETLNLLGYDSSKDTKCLLYTSKRVAVVGAGYIGVELAEAFQRHGKEVILIYVVDTCCLLYTSLGFGLTGDADKFTVSVPRRRWDISIQADLVEEIARIYGYEKLPTTLPEAVSYTHLYL